MLRKRLRYFWIVGLFFVLWGDALAGNLTDTLYLHQLVEKADTYIDKGNYDSAYRMADKARVLVQQTRYTRAYATALNRLGVASRWKGNLSQALDFFSRSLHIADSLNDWRLRANNLTNIGAVHRMVGDYSKALAA
ncbi:MAG TPA: tetratricopeptide repeat protein, partial [Williamwhitmania sp.]|nr:tetratricopeptide repeat protein [Williamwhitmania sp.]